MIALGSAIWHGHVAWKREMTRKWREMAVIYPLPSALRLNLRLAGAIAFRIGLRLRRNVRYVDNSWRLMGIAAILINIWIVRFFAEVESKQHSTTASRDSLAPSQPVFIMAGREHAALVTSGVTSPRCRIPRVIEKSDITLTVNPNDPNQFGGFGSNAYPFVIAFKSAGSPVMAHITNAVIVISLVSTGSNSGYRGSRMLIKYEPQGINNYHATLHMQICGIADTTGRPWTGHNATIVLTCYSILPLLTLSGWGNIFLSHLRVWYAWGLQRRDEAHLMKASIKKSFCVIIWICTVWYRCPVWVDASDIDLDICRRSYASYVNEE
ncbi:hypothetical protein BDW68DRAFT_191059 [Aspergillus falconensis]